MYSVLVITWKCSFKIRKSRSSSFKLCFMSLLSSHDCWILSRQICCFAPREKYKSKCNHNLGPTALELFVVCPLIYNLGLRIRNIPRQIDSGFLMLVQYKTNCILYVIICSFYITYKHFIYVDLSITFDICCYFVYTSYITI